VRSTTNEYGTLEDRYEYDAFGKPYKGDLTTGMNLGYTGKPYDTATGLYNYGYRDYQPEVARFTTVDPKRDGANWFAYVNNDPVNWVDLWGLRPLTQKEKDTYANASNSPVNYNSIDVQESMPTYKEVRDILERNGIDTKPYADYQLQDWIESRDAISLPGTIYSPNRGTTPADLALMAHEIEHQAQYQNNNTKDVLQDLINEAAMPNNAAYNTPGTREYEAQQVQNRAEQQLRDNCSN
jgi:RHS repeat-associated protein